MSRLTLAQANAIITAAFAKGRELNLKPLSVVVLDAGGHVLAFQRQDGASNMRFDIARGKASGALALGVSSRTLGTMAAERPSFVASLGAIAVAFVAPDSFSVFLSITFFVGLVAGGAASIGGTIVGAVFIEFVPNLADKVSKAAPGAVYGVILIAMMFLMPQGAGGFLYGLWRRMVRLGGK